MEFEDFLDRHLDGLARYARLLAGSREDADDLLADTLIAVYRRWSTVAQMDSPLAYVRTALRHGATRQRKRWYARNVRPCSPDDLPDQADTDAADVVVLAWSLDQALLGLHSRDRAAVIMRYYLDFTYQQIADELRVSIATARSVVARALKKLRQQLPNTWGEELQWTLKPR